MAYRNVAVTDFGGGSLQFDFECNYDGEGQPIDTVLTFWGANPYPDYFDFTNVYQDLGPTSDGYTHYRSTLTSTFNPTHYTFRVGSRNGEELSGDYSYTAAAAALLDIRRRR